MGDSIEQDRDLAIQRHDLDSGIFQGRYVNYNLGKYTDEFIYGRYQLFEEVKSDLETLPQGARILDLGCGTGHLAKFIKDKGFDVVGLDPSEGMLQYARDNFKDIDFIKGISADLPFEDNSFDYVVAIEVLRYLHAGDVVNSYKEIYRVLKPGGLMTVTHVNKRATDFYFPFYHFMKGLKKLQGKNYHNCYFTTPAREKNIIKLEGFSEVWAIGRMFASIRIAYKFGKFIGRTYAKFLENLFSKNQNFKKPPYYSYTGHLILKGYK